MNASFNFQHDNGFVVEAVVAALETRDVGQDGVGDLSSGAVEFAADDGRPAPLAVHDTLLVLGIEYAIGDEDDGVARLRGDGELIVADVGKHAEREALS